MGTIPEQAGGSDPGGLADFDCVHGAGDGVDEDLPEEGAYEGPGGVGHGRGSGGKDAGMAQGDEGAGGKERRKEGPEVAEHGLPVLRGQVADHQPPRQSAPGPEVGEHLAREPRGIPEDGFWGVDGHGGRGGGEVRMSNGEWGRSGERVAGEQGSEVRGQRSEDRGRGGGAGLLPPRTLALGKGFSS